MDRNLQPATVPPLKAGDARRENVTADPGRPETSGYAEPGRTAAPIDSKPNPDAAGNEAAQVASTFPGEEEEPEPDTEPTPPGEHKREPIHDPDPADTKLHVQQTSR